MTRLDDLNRFYHLIDRLKSSSGARTLVECTGRTGWPMRGVYFFFEFGEMRDSGSGRRIVRVGTHALTKGSRSSLWKRLSQHKGVVKTGGGNHRGSIFRLLVGTALIARDGYEAGSWGQGSTAKGQVRHDESALEQEVSRVIQAMPLVFLPVEDEPGPESLRGYIERNAIALLSNFRKTALDCPSQEWLGRWCNRERVRESGLWNQNHVDEAYTPAFLDKLEALVEHAAAEGPYR